MGSAYGGTKIPRAVRSHVVMVHIRLRLPVHETISFPTYRDSFMFMVRASRLLSWPMYLFVRARAAVPPSYSCRGTFT